MPADAVENLVLYQVAALDGFVRSRGGTLTHVKPHGALYHGGAEFPDVARAIAEGVRRFRPSLVLVGAGRLDADRGGPRRGPRGRGGGLRRPPLPARRLDRAARRRRAPLITDPDEAAEQAILLARDRRRDRRRRVARSPVRADTLCLHGDTPGVERIARRIHERFRAEGIRIAPLEPGRASRREGVVIPPG